MLALSPSPIIGKNNVFLSEKFGANEDNNYQMISLKLLWGLHVRDMPNFYMMVGPQSLNPVTNVTLLCEEQGKIYRRTCWRVKKMGIYRLSLTQKSVEEWTEKCNVSSNGKIWLQCNNWYMKGTKDDEKAGREKSKAMWMESYESYLEHLIEKGGTRNELLEIT